MAGDYVEIKTPSYNSHFPHDFLRAIAESGIEPAKIEIWGSPDLTVAVKGLKKSEVFVRDKSEEVKWKRELRSPRCRIGWSSSPR